MMNIKSIIRACVLASFCLLHFPALAQGTGAESQASENATYPPDFFQRYQVNTALEMVNRVPGFSLDDGGDLRGFGTSVGNILINDKRPSTKGDAPSAILARISADQVEKIELIRVKVRDIDLQGHIEVVNVVLNADSPAIYRWELHFRETVGTGSSPGGSISLSDNWNDVEFNVGVDARWAKFGDPGTVSTFDGDGVLTEIRTNTDNADGPTANAYLNASSWLGETFTQLNSRVGIENRDIMFFFDNVPQLPGEDPNREIITTLRR
ncbi:MAG: Plug domain-containing protein, partial [Gammaproteobacteria bacterium]|nr:Plug domain-containing protein [Gammaproteobacteria bacterium]